MPTEIEDMIISELEPSAAIALAQVNRHYHDVVSLFRIDKGKVKSFLRKLELSRTNPDFACYTCLRLKPKDEFTVKNTKGKKGKHGQNWFERCCLSCCLEKNTFTPGSLVRTKDGQEVQAVCRGCKKLEDDFCARCIYCRECAGRADDLETLHAHQELGTQVEVSEFCGGAQRKHRWYPDCLISGYEWGNLLLAHLTGPMEGGILSWRVEASPAPSDDPDPDHEPSPTVLMEVKEGVYCPVTFQV